MTYKTQSSSDAAIAALHNTFKLDPVITCLTLRVTLFVMSSPVLMLWCSLPVTVVVFVFLLSLLMLLPVLSCAVVFCNSPHVTQRCHSQSMRMPFQVKYADGPKTETQGAERTSSTFASLTVCFLFGLRLNVLLGAAKLFVAKLDRSTTEQTLRDAFAPYGNIEEVYLMRDSQQQSRGD